ncbi:MAG: phosphoenolpyruvate--protein phosphotransferase [Deltaproteobacteria bacterium]|nr:phosphoenolpyruvate--protein phosphotransferase [Deltaproteobacteria bacterium]
MDQNILHKGIGASPGIIISKALLVDHGRPDFSHYRLSDENQIIEETARLKKALDESKRQLIKVKQEVSQKKIKEAQYIIDTHILILQDRILIDDTIKRIKNDKIDAAWALKNTIRELRKNINEISDDYMQERTSDIEYIEKRILRNLAGKKAELLSNITEKVIIVATDLSPADTANLNVSEVLGFLTEIGGKTSHTAIMARALKIPSVVGLQDITSQISNGDMLIIDGSHGVVIINPDSETLFKFQEKKEQYEEFERGLLKYKTLSPESRDGYRIQLLANIEIVEEVTSVIDFGAEGIGLFRTEFLYINKKELPGEEDLFSIFKDVILQVTPHPVTIRTLDIGGDKFLSHIEVADEMNPAMGLRAIRFCLREISIFKTQLRAILRASAFGRVKILFPMISCVTEVKQIKQILKEVKADLKKEKKAFDPGIEIGIMIEVPSAATIADLLAREVDFFSIGTNDLIQYLLAIDRVNEQVSYLYQPLHPAVLRLLRRIIDSAHDQGIPVAMCGEMAGEPMYLSILLGMGIDELSMNPISILETKKVLRSLTYNDCKALTEKVFSFSTSEEIKTYLEKKTKNFFSKNGLDK